MGELGAVARLRQTEQNLRSYAEERNLSLAPDRNELTLEQQRGPFRTGAWWMTGVLPGGASGRLRHQAAFGEAAAGQIGAHQTVLLLRVPESVGYLPLLTVRPSGLTGEALWSKADRRRRQRLNGFESVELDRRFVIEVAEGQDENWLRQLLAEVHRLARGQHAGQVLIQARPWRPAVRVPPATGRRDPGGGVRPRYDRPARGGRRPRRGQDPR